jgi:hypothetical protein
MNKDYFMKKSVFICISLAVIFSIISMTNCQNKLASEIEYSTTINGRITKPNLASVGGKSPVSGAVISSDSFSTSSDISGYYSLTIIHNGSFRLKISESSHADYNETVSTTDQTLTRNLNYSI